MEQKTDAPLTKQTIWERRLLDLSLRNSLLNFRPGGSSVQLLTGGLAGLEDALSQEESFRLVPVPAELSPQEAEGKLWKMPDSETEKQLIEREIQAKRLPACLSEAELEKTLKKLHRQSKVSLEENGANTLYLALGFLRWYENDKSDKARLAPLVLLPVELTRKIQNRSYAVRIRDEEPQMNITLLELLRQDFGIAVPSLSPLPEDENGVNLPLVFDTMRKSVASMKRWSVEEAAFLGQFSFNRFIMWNDIRSRCDDLQKNKVVASLIAGKMVWQPESAAAPEQLDTDVTPSDMAVPASADSSQLSAVYEAARDESFVLHGPPGTGKSQTITNMIANALYQRKTVLFVAEKMAALSVVQKRLEKIGLDPFCLELHSNKAQKKAVLSQLEKTMNTVKTQPPEEYQKTAERLLEKRKALNETVTALHRKQAHGLSLYELIVLYEQNAAYKDRLNVPSEQVRELSEADLEHWTSAVRALALAGKEAAVGNDSPFRHCYWSGYTPELRDRFIEAAKRLSGEAENAAEAYEAAFGKPAAEIAFARACAESARAAEKAEYILPLTAESAELSIRREDLNRLITDGLSLKKLSEETDAEFDAAVSGWDAGGALLRWKAAEQKWALPKSIEQGKLLKEMAVYRKAGKPTPEQFQSGCEKLAEQKRLTQEIAGANGALTAFFGALWNGASTDFERLDRCFRESAALNETFRPLRGTDQLKTILSGEAVGALKAYADAFERYTAAETELKNSYAADFAGIYGEAPCCFGAARAEAEGWISNRDSLREHCALMAAKEQAETLGLSFLTKPLFAGDLTPDELEPSLQCGFSYTAANLAISADPLLSSFRGAQFEDAIARYRALDEEFERLTVRELTARLSAKIPDTSASGAGSSELGILLKAIRSGGRMLSIRKLFSSIPNLLRRICPCMLMSPISVAQYINPSFPKFDLVIFDEASQLPTSEAVGAIARGKNAVIVGDPKQLPPTSFFDAAHADEEETAEIDDLESVLDDCLALAMPQKRLQWHYRSRHESLIAFSNAQYYENSLKTFPSPDDLVSRVKWIHVEGYYDKSGSRQNPAEAQAVTAEIVRRLSDEQLRKESIGVVTFSLVQQILIDDLLNEEFRKNPKLEEYADQMYEPILVKNLENVQGDERDVILFSIGYGPDQNGRVSMNFGPLNREGGWRRLNVAITRARKSMLIYSTLTPDQIDISHTSSDGVAGLKGFLEFAQKGSAFLPARTRSEEAAAGFAELLSDEIRAMGYETRCNIGCSAYKIDVGVVDPDDPDSYILGIQCDGTRYLSSGTARDRSIVQPGVLNGLGWHILNVWILDMFDSKEKTLARVKTAIEEALRDKRHAEEEQEEQRQEAAGSPEKEPEKPSGEKTEQLPQTEPEMTSEEKTEQAPQTEPEMTSGEKTEQAPQTELEKTPEKTALGTIPYTSLAVKKIGTAEAFYLPETIPEIHRLCEKILAAEAPISRRSLLKKVLSAYGVPRSSAKAEQQLDAALAGLNLSATSSDSGVFYWAEGMSPVNYPLCRVPVSGSEKRSMDEICPQEIANGVKWILNNQLSMSKEDLIRETAKLFGYTRLGEAIEASAAEGIDAALRKGFASESDGRISCREA